MLDIDSQFKNPSAQSTLETAGAPPSRVRWGVLALVVTMAVLLYIDRYAFTVAMPEMQIDMGLSKADLGKAVSAFFLVYGLMQVPGGWLADRLGPRRALTLYVSSWSLAIVAIGLSRSLTMLIAARLMLGVSQAGAYPAAAGLIKKWIPFERRGFANGAVTMGGRAGSMLSAKLTPKLMGLMPVALASDAASWRPVLMLYGAVGFLWAGVFYFWFRNTPGEHPRANAAEVSLIEPPTLAQAKTTVATARPPTPWLAIVGSLNVWLLCLVNFFVTLGWIFLATWLADYLREVHHISRDTAGTLTAGTALAGMAGCLTGGWVTDRLVRSLGLVWGRRIPGLLSCGGAAAAYMACYAGQQSTVVVVAVTAAAYFLSDLVLGTVWASYQDIGGSSVGVVLAIANMCGNLGGGYFAGKIGVLAERGDWSSVMLICSASFVAAMICWLFIDPRVPIVRPAETSPAAGA
jgi:sugar phosphate permease